MEIVNNTNEQLIDDSIRFVQKMSQLFKYVEYKVVSFCMMYFIDYINSNHIESEQILPTLLACFHLSSKVNEIRYSITNICNSIKEFGNPEVITQLPKSVIYNETFKEESLSELQKKIVSSEMNVIVFLNFSFEKPLPHRLADSIINRIITWHINKANQLFHSIMKDLQMQNRKIMNRIVFCPHYYTVPHRVLALVIVKLVFDLYSIDLNSESHRAWIEFFDTTMNSIDFEYSYIPFRMFLDDSIQIEDLTEGSLKAQKANYVFVKRIKYPIYPSIDSFEPKCEPPELSTLEKISGCKNIYSNLHHYHVPILPPPPFETENTDIPQMCLEPLDVKCSREKSFDQRDRNPHNNNDYQRRDNQFRPRIPHHKSEESLYMKQFDKNPRYSHDHAHKYKNDDREPFNKPRFPSHSPSRTPNRDYHYSRN